MKELSPRREMLERAEDMCFLALKRNKPVFSAFLNDAQQFFASEYLKGRSDTLFSFWGGSEYCVRKLLCVCTYETENGDFPIFPLSCRFRKADKPGHRDFLGAFMAQGITREQVGDIFVGEGCAVIFCTKTAADIISGSVSSVGRVGISFSEGITQEASSALKEQSFEEITVVVASERADCAVSAITGLSREKAAAFMRSGNFLLNHTECGSVSKALSPGDILTLHGYGKYIYPLEAQTTAKGRLRLVLKKYS